MLLLSACGGQGNGSPNVIPTPTVKTGGLALPTKASPTIDLTTIITLQDTFTHASQRFSINHPKSWQVIDQPDGVIIAEPGGQAGYSVIFSNAGETYSPAELAQFLVTYVAQNYAHENSNFQAISQQTQPDGSIVAEFSWLDPNLGQTISQVRVTQKDNIVFVVHLNAIENQWANISPHLQSLANTFLPLEPSPTVQSTPVPPEWTLIGPDSKEFGFLYANNWEILAQEPYLISVGSAENEMTFTASSFDWPNATSDSKAAENAALAHLEEVRASYSNVQHLPLAPFPMDTASGATIDFLYTTADGQMMAGSVITGVGNGKMHKIVFTAPTDFYDAALQWFNPMYKSFKFLSPDEFISEQ